MHAKAGEADRHIRTKMVRLIFFDYANYALTLSLFQHSRNICSLASGRWARPIADDFALFCFMLSGMLLYCIARSCCIFISSLSHISFV